MKLFCRLLTLATDGNLHITHNGKVAGTTDRLIV